MRRRRAPAHRRAERQAQDDKWRTPALARLKRTRAAAQEPFANIAPSLVSSCSPDVRGKPSPRDLPSGLQAVLRRASSSPCSAPSCQPTLASLAHCPRSTRIVSQRESLYSRALPCVYKSSQTFTSSSKATSIPALAPDAEIVVLAGRPRTGRTSASIGDVADRWAGARAILYVPGNHEYYGSDIEGARRTLADECRRYGVTLLDRHAVTIDAVRFIGATLWTDFALNGPVDEPWAHYQASQIMSDFTGAIEDRSAPDGLFTTHASARLHAEDRAFIEAQLRETQGSAITPIVITHHAPSRRCVRPWYARSALNSCFASDLDQLIAQYQPPLWVHGHLHDPVDEMLGETRVIANPRGDSRVEGYGFNPELVIDI